MSTLKTVEPFGEGFISALCPELILFAGLILLIIVPNLGTGKFRVPGTQTRVYWLFGGNRFKLTSDPRLPSWIAVITIGSAFLMSILSFQDGVERTAIVSEGGTEILRRNCGMLGKPGWRRRGSEVLSGRIRKRGFEIVFQNRQRWEK